MAAEAGATDKELIEVFRSRARSLAALTAAAAGGLAVGLVLLPTGTLDNAFARFLSVLGLIALLSSTVLFGFASTARASHKSGWARILEVITLRQALTVEPQSDATTYITVRDKLKREIFFTSDLAGGLATISCVFLTAAVMLALIITPPSVVATFDISNPLPRENGCGSTLFDGEVSKGALDSNSKFVAVVVTNDFCTSTPEPMTFYLPRATISTVLVKSEQ